MSSTDANALKRIIRRDPDHSKSSAGRRARECNPVFLSVEQTDPSGDVADADAVAAGTGGVRVEKGAVIDGGHGGGINADAVILEGKAQCIAVLRADKADGTGFARTKKDAVHDRVFQDRLQQDDRNPAGQYFWIDLCLETHGILIAHVHDVKIGL